MVKNDPLLTKVKILCVLVSNTLEVLIVQCHIIGVELYISNCIFNHV